MGLPRGTVTFLFTDIEGSTRRFQELGDDFVQVLEEHHRRLREAVAAHHGVEVKTEGDAFFVAFADPADAIGACLDAQLALQVEDGWPHGRPVRVRMGVHTGKVNVVGDDYVGLSVHEAARVAGAGHGGQVLVSEDTAALVADRLPSAAGLQDLGRHALKDFPEPKRIFQLTHPGLEPTFPPLGTLTARSHNLPRAPGLLGREAELESIRGLVLGDARLVSLVGGDRAGRSRLAIEAGWSLLSWFAEGVWLVGLGAVTSPADVHPCICEALDVPAEILTDRLSKGPILLIADNLEFVPKAATTLADLLATCPPLRILATSRDRLRLRGEHVLRVDA